MKIDSNEIYYSSPVWLQNWLISIYGLNLYRKRYLGRYKNILKLVETSWNWSSNEINIYQSEELYKIIKHCRNKIPYYQKLFADYGFHENDFTSINDISKLPIATKKIILENQSKIQLPNANPYFIQKTSGSTGTPLSLWVDEFTYKLAMALLVSHEKRSGIEFGERRATFAGRMIKRFEDNTPPFSRFNFAENQKIYSSYHLSSTTFKFYCEDLESFRPVEIIGYPSAICDLASFYKKEKIKPGFKLKAIITNSETLHEWQRDIIESVFNSPVYDYYGTAEYIIFASQNKKGFYDLNPVIGLTEINDKTDQGESWPIITTTLTNYTMPLLRYEIGDNATAVSRNGSQSSLASLKSIDGRKDDYIVSVDGRKIGRIDHIFKGIKGVKEAQVIQDHKKQCTIQVVLSNGDLFNEKKLTENFKSRVGNSMNLGIKYVTHIPRGANGKFKSVIRKKEL
jgi:phenylacetate-CoA ligase